jgi:hypothetical protein
LASSDQRHLVATGAAFSKAGDARAFCTESVEIALIETHLSPVVFAEHGLPQQCDQRMAAVPAGVRIGEQIAGHDAEAKRCNV